MIFMIITHLALFWSVALISSIYFGIRGVLITIRSLDEKAKKRSKFERVFIQYLQGFILNFSCAIAGFIALFAVIKIADLVQDFAKIQAGTAVLVTFLSLVAITGISGILPELLYHGKIFGTKS